MLPLKQELEQRWLLKQYTDENLFSLYSQGGYAFYFGMDPTADSLHLGNFINFMNAIHLMRRGNICIPLIGGATGMIGDPGGKDSERTFLSEDVLTNNIAAINKQIQWLIANIREVTGEDLQVAEIVNNKDFYHEMGFLDFLREVGKYITVNSMIHKETVKKRIEDADKSISYTEFSYMLIQGYDFLRLYEDREGKYSDTKGCKLQIAWSDQRGNITTGTELIRKKLDAEAYGMTSPLILDSTGKKFGKSEGNALWLDSTKTSPYTMYQYFLNTSDEDVERYLHILTLYDLDTIAQIVATHQQDLARRYGQSMLATYVVKLIFGEEEARQAEMITQILFGKENPLDMIATMSEEDIGALQQETGGVKFWILNFEFWIVELLVQTWLASSNGDAKKLIESRGVSCQEKVVEDIHATVSASDAVNGVILLRKGKKNFRVVLVC